MIIILRLTFKILSHNTSNGAARLSENLDMVSGYLPVTRLAHQ